MRYYKIVKDGVLQAIGIGPESGEEIREAEYNDLMAEIQAKAGHVDAVCADPLAIDAVPQEWRDEILRRVEERRQAEQEAQSADISADELGRMMMEVL